MSEEIKLSEIEVDNDFNCRGEEITPSDVFELMGSIKEHGLLQPVLVRPSRTTKYKYFLFAGFRRYAACKFLGMETIRCEIHRDISDKATEEINLVENIKRRNLTIVQEARGINKLYLRGESVEAIAKVLEQGREWVNVRIALLQLPEDIQREASAGLLNQKDIKELLPIYKKDKERAYAIVKQLKEKKLKKEKKSVDSETKKQKVIKTRTFRPFSEIFEIQDILLLGLGTSLASRAIAWTISEISTWDLMVEIKREMDLLKLPWIIPQEYYDPKYKKDKVNADSPPSN